MCRCFPGLTKWTLSFCDWASSQRLFRGGVDAATAAGKQPFSQMPPACPAVFPLFATADALTRTLRPWPAAAGGRPGTEENPARLCSEKPNDPPDKPAGFDKTAQHQTPQAPAV